VIDLGKNFHRFGPWGADLDWQRIFNSPDFYLDKLLDDESIESQFNYEMPPELKEAFKNSENLEFDVKEIYKDSIINGESSKVVLERSIDHHAKICIENSEDEYDALALAKLLGDSIDHRILRYSQCISKSTHNFLTWLKDDYRKKLRMHIRNNFEELFLEIHGHAPVE
jgi:hypothetical protein